MQVRPGPWDSPAVIRRSAIAAYEASAESPAWASRPVEPAGALAPGAGHLVGLAAEVGDQLAGAPTRGALRAVVGAAARLVGFGAHRRTPTSTPSPTGSSVASNSSSASTRSFRARIAMIWSSVQLPSPRPEATVPVHQHVVDGEDAALGQHRDQQLQVIHVLGLDAVDERHVELPFAAPQGRPARPAAAGRRGRADRRARDTHARPDGGARRPRTTRSSRRAGAPEPCTGSRRRLRCRPRRSAGRRGRARATPAAPRSRGRRSESRRGRPGPPCRPARGSGSARRPAM